MNIVTEPVLIRGGTAVDDRGSLLFCNDFHFEGVKRFYQVRNHRAGFIRAWHGHRHETKYVWAACGSAIVAAVPLTAAPGDISAVKTFVLSEQVPAILMIPAGYYNGFMTLEAGTRLQFFSTATMEETRNDDIRQPYDLWDIWRENFR